MEFNLEFIKNIQQVYQADGQDWLKALPKLIEELQLMWGLKLIRPMENLSYSFVGQVSLDSSWNQPPMQTAILKLTPKGGPINQEVSWLKVFVSGVPIVFMHSPEHFAVLMEELAPGKTLKSVVQEGRDQDATRIICSSIRTLQSHQLVNEYTSKYKHLSDLQGSLPLLRGKMDSRLVEKAISLFRDLTEDRQTMCSFMEIFIMTIYFLRSRVGKSSIPMDTLAIQLLRLEQ